MPKESVPRGLALFGKRLLKARKAAGLTQEQTAEKIGYSRHVVSHAESGHQPPSREVAVALDRLFGTDDLFADLWDDMARDRRPGWIVALVHAEGEAVKICLFESIFFPGLLQTPDYARGILNSGVPTLTDDELAERVATRLQRQEILGGDRLESLWAIVDESVLYRFVDGKDTMCEQLEHVRDLICSRRIRLQVLPYSAGAYPASGPFGVYDLSSGQVVHLDSATGGHTVSDTSTVKECVERYEVLRAQAFSPTDSLRMIERRIEDLR